MKQFLFHLGLSILIGSLFFACNKKELIFLFHASSLEDENLIENAKQYFNYEINRPSIATTKVSSTNERNNQRKRTQKAPLWGKAYTIRLSIGKAVIVPLVFEQKIYLQASFAPNKSYLLDDLAKLLVYECPQGHYHSEIVTSFPDSNFSSKQNSIFSGILVVEDWMGTFLHEFQYSDGKIKYLKSIQDSASIVSAQTAVNAEDQSRTGTNSVASKTVCYSIEEYNYSVEDPNNGEYSSESIGCNTYFFEDGANIGGTPSGTDYGAASGGSNGYSISVYPGSKVIKDIHAYLNCFDNVPGNDHRYSVSICVDEPKPGTREAWGFSLTGIGGSSSGGAIPFTVGHTFFTFSETSTSGTVTRNIGFYPTNLVSPKSPSSQGELSNDDIHSYNISLSIALDNAQFFNMLSFISQGANQGYMYDLNTNNCSTFVLNALSTVGVNLPRTIGQWPGGSGNNPGDLGEDMRSMPLSPNMARSTLGVSHPNQGNCVVLN